MVEVKDIALESGYQDFWFDTFKRGRGNLVADFDGDGDLDVFSGNPGNHSYLLMNTTVPGGPISFVPGQVLSEEELHFGGVAADFDNDGDADLFAAMGANDGAAMDYLMENVGDPDAPLVDTQQDLVLLDDEGLVELNGTMGGRGADFNNDGLLDVWASNWASENVLDDKVEKSNVGRNQLYLNQGGLVLRDAAVEVGLGTELGSRNSAVFDFDHDGDMDIYENNFVGTSMLWSNRLDEAEGLAFSVVTAEFSLHGTSLEAATISQAMCAIPSDVNNDGWEDLLVLLRGAPADKPGLLVGHQVYLNQGGLGFVEAGALTGINARWWEHPKSPGGSDTAAVTTAMGVGDDWGVMGCQVGDLNLDGFPDVFMGNGVGVSGAANHLFVSAGAEVEEVDGYGEVLVPKWEDWSGKIDFPAIGPAGVTMPPYGYRSHGTAIADFDGDGVSELGVHNGGPAAQDHLEPNRLFTFALPDPRFLRVSLVGDGVTVNRDGVGARVRMVVRRDEDGAEWTVYQTRFAGTGFGSQNSPELVLGMGDGDEIVELEVTWPDGHVELLTPPKGVRNWLTAHR